MTQLNAARTIGGTLFVIGTVSLGMSVQIPLTSEGGTGARIFPIIASLSITVLGFLEFGRGWRRDTPPLVITDRWPNILGLLALAICYTLLIAQLGYLIATAVVAPFAMYLFGIRNPLGLLTAAIICPTLFHLIFIELLGVFPPYGQAFDLLDLLQGT